MAKAVIMVPNEKLPGYHQVKNAAAYEKANAAVVVADDKMHEDPELLLKAIRRLINHPEERDEISKNLKKFSKDNAAENLANTVISVAKE
jgi:UDP-N-acetylglucosamine:LPS N-acetylglucosamine transferase